MSQVDEKTKLEMVFEVVRGLGFHVPTPGPVLVLEMQQSTRKGMLSSSASAHGSLKGFAVLHRQFPFSNGSADERGLARDGAEPTDGRRCYQAGLEVACGNCPAPAPGHFSWLLKGQQRG